MRFPEVEALAATLAEAPRPLTADEAQSLAKYARFLHGVVASQSKELARLYEKAQQVWLKPNSAK